MSAADVERYARAGIRHHDERGHDERTSLVKSYSGIPRIERTYHAKRTAELRRTREAWNAYLAQIGQYGEPETPSARSELWRECWMACA